MRFEHTGVRSNGCLGLRSPKVIQGYQGSLYVEILVSLVTCFCLSKYPKMGCMKHVMMVEENPRNGVIRYNEKTTNDL